MNKTQKQEILKLVRADRTEFILNLFKVGFMIAILGLFAFACYQIGGFWAGLILLPVSLFFAGIMAMQFWEDGK